MERSHLPSAQAAARGPAWRVSCGLWVALVLLPASPLYAQGVSIQASLGWDGWIRYGTWNPLTVEVRTDRQVGGWLAVELPREFGRQRLRLRYPITLPPGGAKSWRLVAFVEDVRRPVRVSVTAEDGQELGYAEVLVQPEAAVASVVGYLGLQPPTPPGQTPGGGRRVVARLREEVLPETPAAYASLDGLVVEELDERRLNEAQQLALQAWVLHGGRVVVTSALDLSGPLGRWLSVARPTGRTYQGARLRSLSGTLFELEPAQDARPVLEGPLAVAFWASRGLGRVYAWAGHPQQVVPDSPLWFLALPAPSSREPPPEPEFRSRLPLGPAAAGLGAYAALWVLAVAVAGRRMWGWLGVAAVLGASVVGMPVLADQVRQRASELDRQWVEVEVEGTSRVYGWGFARATYPGVYVHALPPADALTVSGGFSEAEATFFVDRTTLRVRQSAGERVGVFWESHRAVELATVEVQGDAVVARGPRLREGVVLWGRRQAVLEQVGPEEWKAFRWSSLEADHPAFTALRRVYPRAATIVEDWPVVAFARGDGRGWQLVVGQAR